MKDTDLIEYRKILEKEFTDKDLEIETSLSYISVGSLGFFITINEKFLKIESANYKFILISSLACIFISFALILYRKTRTCHHDLKMIEFVNQMKPNSKKDDKKLLELWDASHKNLSKIKLIIYISLGIGIGLQVLFMIFNI